MEPTARVLGKQFGKFLASHPAFSRTVDAVFSFYCNANERTEQTTMNPKSFHKMVRDAGLLNSEFTQNDAATIEQEAKPAHRPRFTRDHFDSALVLIAGKVFHSFDAVEALTRLLTVHFVPLAESQLLWGKTESTEQAPEVGIAYQYDDCLRFVYFYYTQQTRMMRSEDFMLFTEDFRLDEQIEPAELNWLFQQAGNKVRAGHMSYSEFVLCLAKCSVRSGGAGQVSLVHKFFDDIVRSKEYAGVEQWHESLEWEPTSANGPSAPQQTPEVVHAINQRAAADKAAAANAARYHGMGHVVPARGWGPPPFAPPPYHAPLFGPGFMHY